MLLEELRDLWICSCGNWVGRLFTWCPECCEERGVPEPKNDQERDAQRKSLGH